MFVTKQLIPVQRETEFIVSRGTNLFIYLFKFGNITKKEIHWDWPAVSEAIRGRPGYIIYYKLDKYKEIRRYIRIYILQ